jgi:hypothetical protein
VLALSTAAYAQQAPRPLPAASPEEFTAPSVHVSVVVHEDLPPDFLRRLARPDVTLWLQTRSNTLRASTLENLARFDEVFVQLRAPLTSVDAQVFGKLPKAGLWLDTPQLPVLFRIPGARPVAIDVSGPLDLAVVNRLSAAKPTVVRWSPSTSINVLEWGLFRQLPGRKIVVMPVSLLRATNCSERSAGQPSVELDLATVLAMNSDVLPCGRAPRVIVRPGVDHWMLQSLVVRDPSAELVVIIGADEEVASATQALLDLLDRHDSR